MTRKRKRPVPLNRWERQKKRSTKRRREREMAGRRKRGREEGGGLHLNRASIGIRNCSWIV